MQLFFTSGGLSKTALPDDVCMIVRSIISHTGAAGFKSVPSDGKRCDLIGCFNAVERKRDTGAKGMKKWQMKIRTSGFPVTYQRSFQSAYR